MRDHGKKPNGRTTTRRKHGRKQAAVEKRVCPSLGETQLGSAARPFMRVGSFKNIYAAPMLLEMDLLIYIVAFALGYLVADSLKDWWNG